MTHVASALARDRQLVSNKLSCSSYESPSRCSSEQDGRDDSLYNTPLGPGFGLEASHDYCFTLSNMTKVQSFFYDLDPIPYLWFSATYEQRRRMFPTLGFEGLRVGIIVEPARGGGHPVDGRLPSAFALAYRSVH